MKSFAGIWIVLWGGSLLVAQDLPKLDAGSQRHHKIYTQVSASVVGVRAKAPVLGERSGTGVVLDQEGYILTSSSIVPERAGEIRVWLSGPRLRTAHLIAVSKRDELALIRIDPTGLQLQPVAMAESSKIEIGSMTYTIGNSFNSIIIDNQPSFNVGVISGIYRLREERGDATYIGTVIETTAAANPGMEGAPLLDAQGRMVGIMTPNFSVNRWLGVAIPIEVVKDVLPRLKERQGDAPGTDEPVETGEGYLGMTLHDRDGKTMIQSVDRDSPAWEAGLREGDVIVELSGTPVKSGEQVTQKLKGIQAGSIVWFKVDVGNEGVIQDVKIRLTGKKPVPE